MNRKNVYIHDDDRSFSNQSLLCTQTAKTDVRHPSHPPHEDGMYVQYMYVPKKALMPRSRAIFRPRRPRPSVPLRLGVLRPTMAMRGGPGVIALVYVGRWRPARPTPPFLDAFVLAGIGDVDVAPGLARVLLLQDTRVFAGLVVVARVESGGVGVGVHCCFVLSCPLVGVGLDSM